MVNLDDMTDFEQKILANAIKIGYTFSKCMGKQTVLVDEKSICGLSFDDNVSWREPGAKTTKKIWGIDPERISELCQKWTQFLSENNRVMRVVEYPGRVLCIRVGVNDGEEKTFKPDKACFYIAPILLEEKDGIKKDG